MAAYVELYMDQGATFNNIITLTDDITNANLNISGYIVRSQMRRSYYSTNASANIICTLTNAVSGEVTLSLPANTTANIKAGRYLFDVETVDRDSNTVRVLEGIVTVTPRVTK
jgi:hypothetical protein